MQAEGAGESELNLAPLRVVQQDTATGVAFCDLESDPELFNGPKGNTQARAR